MGLQRFENVYGNRTCSENKFDYNFKIILFTVIKKENTLICQFASPLDVDTHNKPEVKLFCRSF